MYACWLSSHRTGDCRRNIKNHRHYFGGDDVTALFDMPTEAAAIETAVHQVLDSGLRTGDMMEDGCTLVGCQAIGQAIAAAI